MHHSLNIGHESLVQLEGNTTRVGSTVWNGKVSGALPWLMPALCAIQTQDLWNGCNLEGQVYKLVLKDLSVRMVGLE